MHATRYTYCRRGKGRHDSDESESDGGSDSSPDDDDYDPEAPLNPSDKKDKFKQTKKSKLWSTDITPALEVSTNVSEEICRKATTYES